MRNVEILAPGGSADAIYAAFACGADAVYTGTERFSARAFADNPTLGQLCEILDYAHLFGKKIYLTVNTLLTEKELECDLYDVLFPLYKAGLDAVIVQDLGVLDFIREMFPGLPIHASTQMSFLTGGAVNLLKPYGVTRVVPARELSLEEIRKMRQETELELEVFVHGALCYCYSGQCLMSEVIGGRSGNRGMCAQPCRLPYEVDGKEGGYVLSTKDLCTLPQIGELMDAGVDSFKIEGRMKKPEYAAYTSHLYRVYADAWLSGMRGNEEELKRDVKRLADIYNRGGFCGGYLFEREKRKVIDTKRNGHYGVCVGKVTRVDERFVEYRVTEKTNYQDVLEFRDGKGNCVYEYTVKEGALPSELVTARYKKGSCLKEGQKVYRTRNQELLNQIGEEIKQGRRRMKKPVSGLFSARAGEPLRLVLQAGGTTAVIEGETAQKAKNQPVSPEELRRRLQKTGESLFEFEELQLEISGDVFFPIGRAAAMRRDGFGQLKEELLMPFRRNAEGSGPQSGREAGLGLPEPDSWGQTEPILVTVTHFGQIAGVKSAENCNPANTRLHVKLDEFSPADWERLDREAGDYSYYISLPAVLRDKNQKKFLQYFKTYGGCFTDGNCKGVLVQSLEALPLIKKMGWEKKELLAGTGLYNWNRRTERMHADFGICGHSYLVYGSRTVMTTEGCARMQLYGCRPGQERQALVLRTPKKDEFTVVNYCDYCYNMIYEKRTRWHEPKKGRGMPEFRFTSEQEEQVRKVLEQWNFLS